jgi:signal peptidase II
VGGVVRAVQERRPEPTLIESSTRAVSALAAATALVVIAIDHATKWWALGALDDRNIDLVWKLRFNLVHNPGAAFGLGSKYAPLFAIVALAIVLVLFRQSAGFDTRVAQVAIGLVLGGAIGNLLDRLFRDGDGFLGGRVVDFIDVQFWPVWNVADMAISFGAVLLALTAGREQSS